MSNNSRIALVMGSVSDWPIMQEAAEILDEFKVRFEAQVLSAHRMPDEMADFAKQARANGCEVIIAGAGGAAHLPGMLAALTPIPVIGVPVAVGTLDGMDSLLSIVQMPSGVPVATVGIGQARNAGLLDIKMVPERHNAVKVLLFFDVGGSMDPHVKVCEELFSAARSEFKHMEYFYFHNFIYESVWRNNFRRHNERMSLLDVLHKYSHDYKVIFVGDAAMSPYEILQPGGSVEHWNEESGELWMRRLQEVYDKVLWINPVPEDEWQYTQSVAITHKLMDGHMYPLTLKGLEEGMAYLTR